MNRKLVIALVAALLAIGAIAAFLYISSQNDAPPTQGEAASGTPAPSPVQPGQADAAPETRLNDDDLEALLATAAEQINAEVPIRIDAITTLTRATTHGHRIRYRYDISEPVSPSRLRANRDQMVETTRRNVCRNATDREIIDAGAEIEFAYYGPGNTYYFSTPVTDCG